HRELLAVEALARRLDPLDVATEVEGQVVGDRAADVGLDPVEPEAVIGAADLVVLIPEAAAPLGAAALGLNGDDARLGIAELGRAAAGGHRRLLEPAGRHVRPARAGADELAAAPARAH